MLDHLISAVKKQKEESESESGHDFGSVQVLRAPTDNRVLLAPKGTTLSF